MHSPRSRSVDVSLGDRVIARNRSSSVSADLLTLVTRWRVGASASVLEGDDLVRPLGPVGQLFERGALRARGQGLVVDSASVKARAAAAYLGVVAGRGLDHAVQVVVTVGHLLTCDRARDGVTHEEDLHLGAFAAREGAREPQAVPGQL